MIHSHPSHLPIHVLFQLQALRSPLAIALDFHDSQLSFSHLNSLANRLAHLILSLRLPPESLIAICLHPSPLSIISMLAVLKAGHAYLPLDPSSPPHRLSLILDLSGVQLILSHPSSSSNLPPDFSPSISLDSLEHLTSSFSHLDPPCSAFPDSLAYVMFTSGSTGSPKGVAIPHRAVVRLVVDTNYVHLSASHRVAHASNPSFDAATFEIWGALLNGACLVGLPKDTLLSPHALADFLRTRHIDVLFLTTALFNQIVSQVPDAFATLSDLLFGGEVADPRFVRLSLSSGPPRRLLHVYGPTEATTFSSFFIVRSVPPDATSVPIGLPISNTSIFLLDDLLRPAAPGRPARLYIGGIGLARGYFRDPVSTALSFIPHPLSSVPGDRLYDSGDLAREDASGFIDFIGRLDHQVKIRGFRVELPEIEAALKLHPLVSEAVVVARKLSGSDTRLLAYLVAGPSSPSAPRPSPAPDLSGHRIWQWQNVYDEVIYRQLSSQASSGGDPSFNITGWVSSYTGLPIPPDQMREQVEQTISRVAPRAAGRVLEIGCGTGLLLLRIAPRCLSYLATDFSEAALDHLRPHIASSPDLSAKVTLLQRPAHDFTGIEPASFDAVILNSVVQYFPNIEYLVGVIEKAVEVVSDGGMVFIGDVRNLALLEEFHTSVQMWHSGEATTAGELRRLVRRRMTQEEELVIDPGFFFELKRRVARVTGVEVQLKRGSHQNEMTKYRYDVRVEVGVEKEEGGQSNREEWEYGGESMEEIKRRAERAEGDEVRVRGVMNRRVAGEVKAARVLGGEEWEATAGELREVAQMAKAEALDPELFWSMTEVLPYSVRVSWSSTGKEASMDVFIKKTKQGNTEIIDTAPDRNDGPFMSKSWSEYANNPLEGFQRRILIAELRNNLKQKLPEYMVPSAFVVMDSLPLTPSGKIDRDALPAPEHGRQEMEQAYIAPRSSLEEILTRIWEEVLGATEVGINDDFFELGGHSLVASHLISRLKETFQVEMPLLSLYESPTIASLAQCIQTIRRVSEGSSRSVDISI